MIEKYLEILKNLNLRMGLSQSLSTSIAETVAALSVVIVSIIIYFIIKFIIKRTVYRIIQLSTNKYDRLPNHPTFDEQIRRPSHQKQGHWAHLPAHSRPHHRRFG